MSEFEVRTESGRRFVWSAFDADDCKRQVERRGHMVISIWPYKEREVK